MLFYIILYLCNLHYTLLYYQLNRYLVSLYQIIRTFTDPENDGFRKTYLDKEKMLVTSSFSCYYNVVEFEIHQGFFPRVGKWPQGRQVGKKCVSIGENLLSDI